MGTIIEEIIVDFTKGITDDPRRLDAGLAQCVSNFDIFTNKKRAIPYRSSEDGDSGSATSQKQAFDMGFWTPGPDWRLFGLGVVSGTGKAEVLMKTDYTNNGWSTPANNDSAAGATSFALFIFYKTVGKFFGAKSGTTIWSFTPDGATAFGDSEHSLSYTTIGQGIIHSKDDTLYIPYDNKIARNNAGVWTDVAISIPSYLTITSIDEYQDYIVIAAAPSSNTGKSVHYLWDRDASLTTLSESYDGGDGVTKVIGSIGGTIVSIGLAGNVGSRFRNRVIFRELTSGGFKKFLEFIAPPSTSLNVLSVKQKADDRIYFAMTITIDGIVREGIWSVGVSSTGAFAVAHERTPANDTSLGNGHTQGFFIVGDYMFISYVDNSGAYFLSKTDDQELYNVTAVYETTVRAAGDSDLRKKLIGVAAMLDPLPANGQISVYYKKDAETAWTRMFVFSGTGKISHGAVNLESDTNAFTVTVASPAVFTLSGHGLVVGQKIRFATTGALPTGLTAGAEYYVISAGFTSSTFQVSTTSGGSAVNTTGTQSGTHTINRTVNLTEGQEFKIRAESRGGAILTALKYKMEVLDKQTF